MRPLAASMVALALASGCGGGPPARPRLVVAAVRQPATSLFFVAISAGCFAAEGIDVEERTFELGRDALDLLQAGKADAAIAFETPVLRAAFSDDRLRALTALHTSTRNTRLIARRDAGVRGFADLAGMRIGVAEGTNADFFIELALKLGGVARQRVALLSSAPETSVRALVDGSLDAAVLSDPPAGEAERLLGDGAVVLKTDLYEEVSLLVTRADQLTARAPALRSLLRGLACAERHAQAQPADAQARIRGRFPEQSDAAFAAQLARVRWGLGLDNVLADLLRREREMLASAGTAPGRPPELSRLLAPRLLEEVLPESVMLLPTPERAPW